MAADWFNLELLPVPPGHMLHIETSYLMPEGWNPRPTACLPVSFGVYPDGVSFPLPACYPHWGENQVYGRKLGHWLQLWQVHYRDRRKIAFYMKDHVPVSPAAMDAQANHVFVHFLYKPLKHVIWCNVV